MTGSVQEKNGKWYLVILYKDSQNKWKTKWQSTGLPIRGNKKAAELMLKNALEDLNENNIALSEMKASDYFEQWLTEQRTMVEPNTYRSYEGNMRNHIIPYFKKRNLKLKDIKTYHLEEYYNCMYSSNSTVSGKRPLSATTIKHHHQNISKELNDAVRKELIRSNPAANARTPKVHKYRCTFLNFSQVNELIELVRGSVIEIPVILIATYGMRRSECLSLKWSDVNFEGMQFTISSAILQHVGGDYERRTTKTESSYRTLPLTQQIKELLENQKRMQAENKVIFKSEYHLSDYICTWPDGRLITPNYLTRKFKQIIKTSDLPDVRVCFKLCVNSKQG